MRQRAIIGLLFLVALSCSLLLYMANSEVKLAAIQALNEQQLTLANQAAKGIQDYFGYNKKYLEILGRNQHVVSLDPEGQSLLQGYQRENSVEVLALTRMDALGRITYSTPDNSVANRDISAQSHIKRILVDHQPVISDVFTSVQGHRTVAFSVPVFRGIHFDGALTMLIAFDVISRRYLEGIHVAESGYAFLLSEKGIMLYAPISGLVGRNIADVANGFPEVVAMFERMLRGEGGEATFTFDRIRDQQVSQQIEHAVYLPIHLESTLWSICVATPELEVLASLKRFQDYLLFVGFATLAIISLCLFVFLRYVLLQKEIVKRQDTETALRNSESKYRSVIENITDVFYRTNAQGMLDMISPSGLLLFGYDSIDEMLGHPAENVWVHPENHRDLLVILEQDGEVRDYEVLLRRKDGTPLHVSTSSRLNRDEAGNVLGVEGILRDITERKRTEEALEEKTAMFDAQVNATIDGILVIDEHQKRAIVNQRVVELFDVPQNITDDEDDALLLKHVCSQVKYPDLFLEKVRYLYDNIYETSRDDVEFKNGMLLDRYSAPVLGKDGKYYGRLWTFRDITERKQSEDALKKSEERLRRAELVAETGNWEIDMSSNRVYASEGAKHIYGLHKDELTFEDIQNVPFPEYRSSLNEKLCALIDKGEPYSVEFKIRRSTDGAVIDVYSTATYDDSRNMVFGIIQDVTERRRMQEAIVQTEKMMSVGGLAAGMAHEINNPLGGILQNAQVLIRRLTSDTAVNTQAANNFGCSFEDISSFMKYRGILSGLEYIRESGERAANVVRDMLEFCRRSESHGATVDINVLLDKSIGLCATDYDLKKNYDFRNLSIVREYNQDLPIVPCSKTQIQQVLMNIVGNAAHALIGTSSPRVTLRTGIDDGFVRIEIEDNGPGMDEATRRRIFEPFFTTKPVGEGTGLGLSVSYFIIKNNHRGTIEVVSELGKGAMFIIRLPLSKNNEESISKPLTPKRL